MLKGMYFPTFQGKKEKTLKDIEAGRGDDELGVEATEKIISPVLSEVKLCLTLLKESTVRISDNCTWIDTEQK